MTSKRRPIALFLLGASLASVPAGATHAGVPSPAQSIDLTRYYPSRDSARAELAALARDGDALPASIMPSQLIAYLDRADALIARGKRLTAYFVILGAKDIDDQAAAAAADQADAIDERIVAKVRVVLGALPRGAFDRMAQRDHRLGRYALLDRQAADRAAHDLPPAAARAFDAIDGPAMNTLWTTYQKIDRLPVATDKADPATSKATDEALREAAWRDRWRKSAVKADANATLLLGIVTLNEAEARLKHYPDAVAAGYAVRGLDRNMVDRSLATVRANLSLYQAYHQLRAARLKRDAGIAVAQPWDLSLFKVAAFPDFTFEDVRRLAPAALAPLGADYVAHFSALLAPASGRLDIGDAVGKRQSGGFSVSAAGVPAGLYMAHFRGSIDDLRVVLHEGGHAIAAQYANEGGTPSFFVRGPNWLMESYALLNEFLLFDDLARTSRLPAERAAYQGLLIDDMMFQVFGSAEEATLEQAIYDGAATGKVQTAADLDALSFTVMRGFEPWSDDAIRASDSVWSTKQLMFQDPFYLVNYLYAGVAAINLYKEAKEHPETFPARYAALLRRGYDAPPMTLLAPLLGNAQTADALTSNAFSIMTTKLAELHSLQEGLDGQAGVTVTVK